MEGWNCRKRKERGREGGRGAIMVSTAQHLLINHSEAAKWQRRGARPYFRLRYQVSYYK